MDVVDGHFVEDGDCIFIGGVFGGFEDDLEPGGIGAAFFVEQDVADIPEIGCGSFFGFFSFIIIYAVVFPEE